MTSKKLGTVSAYIAAAPATARPMLKKLRAIVRAVAPSAEEKISYGMPTYRSHGPLVCFAAFQHHVGVYAMSSTFFGHYKELKKYQTSVGTLQFPYGKPLPVSLIKRLVKEKMKLNEKRATSY